MPAPRPLSRDTCPACKRFTGQQLECPYCGLDSPHLPLQRALQLAAFTLSVTGLAILLLIGQPPTPSIISISQLRPVMNHGFVSLAGTVVARPRISGTPAAPQTVSFDLVDAGGKLTVMATQAAAKMLLRQDNLPSAHHPVQVTGHLYLAAGKSPRLYLDSAHSLKRYRQTAPARFPIHE
ncbi:MAG: hypothetical protein WCI95_06070 [bacterium]